MKFGITLLLVVLVHGLKAQPTARGLIMPTESYKGCCIYVLDSGFNLYTEPQGELVGKLIPGPKDGNGEVYRAFVQISGVRKVLGYENTEMVGYEVLALAYESKKDGFVQLQEGYWLSIKEIEGEGLKLLSQLAYIIEKDTEWYAGEEIILRETPETSGRQLAIMKGNTWGIRPTGQTRGNWCKVKVIHYRKHPCSGEANLVIEEFTGWAKVTSDNGHSRVWDYSKGC